MNKLTRQINELLLPKAALIAYHCTENDPKYYLEMRTIDPQGRMGEARPVSCEFLNDLAESYSESYSGTPFGPVPRTQLYCDTRKGRERLVWFNPPTRRMLFFGSDLGLENSEYNLPGVVYVAGREELAVYAFKGECPEDDEQLFLAPFFNTSSSQVCLGTARLERPQNPTYGELMAYWEHRFWQSEFTHLSSEGNPTVHNLVLVTRAARDEPFDLEELKPHSKTLKTLFK